MKRFLLAIPIIFAACAPAYAGHEVCYTPEQVVAATTDPRLSHTTLQDEAAAVFMAAYNRSEPASDVKADVIQVWKLEGGFRIAVIFYNAGCQIERWMYHENIVAKWIEGVPLSLNEQKQLMSVLQRES